MLLGRVARLESGRRRVDVLSGEDAGSPGRASRRSLRPEKADLDSLLFPPPSLR